MDDETVTMEGCVSDGEKEVEASAGESSDGRL